MIVPSKSGVNYANLESQIAIYNTMLGEGLNDYYQNVEYNIEFDNFLYKEVGYPKLSTLSQHIYASPYAATSLREYFATGFVEYLMGDRNYLRSVSPALYKKIEYLIGEENEN